MYFFAEGCFIDYTIWGYRVDIVAICYGKRAKKFVMPHATSVVGVDVSFEAPLSFCGRYTKVYFPSAGVWR